MFKLWFANNIDVQVAINMGIRATLLDVKGA
jgi:hypothetical protein